MAIDKMNSRMKKILPNLDVESSALVETIVGPRGDIQETFVGNSQKRLFSETSDDEGVLEIFVVVCYVIKFLICGGFLILQLIWTFFLCRIMEILRWVWRSITNPFRSEKLEGLSISECWEKHAPKFEEGQDQFWLNIWCIR
eukprot:gnl/MRDRNA2_/MRDRNA2_136174_c0_seq1.p1 gnl/MRDRNA2_/MRDRNA2_136174_c0~~gnl/MRDRNA2_/MRDRNA2_136174_c0_seq1.p1  ORF type:complete len:150 (-),score=21.38 gnl/MRDRNA2_/MRDRNA2_136174_c0_seq1:232-657(-)